MQSSLIKINDKVKVKIKSDVYGTVGTVTGIAVKIPAHNSDVLIVSFEQPISEDGSTTTCIPYGHLVKV